MASKRKNTKTTKVIDHPVVSHLYNATDQIGCAISEAEHSGHCTKALVTRLNSLKTSVSKMKDAVAKKIELSQARAVRIEEKAAAKTERKKKIQVRIKALQAQVASMD